MTKDNWIKALHKTATDYVLSKSQSGPYDLAFSCDEEVKDLENLLSQVEKDAIEKTNKRWELRLEEAKRVAVQVARSFIIDREIGIPPQNPLNEDLYVKYLNGEIDTKLSDLIEDKHENT